MRTSSVRPAAAQSSPVWRDCEGIGENPDETGVKIVALPALLMNSPDGDSRTRLCIPDPREHRIREVLAAGGLTMMFQPIVDLRTGCVVGAESLARIRSDPYRTPDVWFAEAWELGIGIELELIAIRQALASLSAMPADSYLSINVAPETLLDPGLEEVIASFPGERVVIELTEHALVVDYDEMGLAIERLRARGCRLAIDDAGAGYSSFQHILRLRPDIIKLDRSLTTGVDVDPVRFALASALVTFSGSLGARICAEGVETATELVALQKLGVTYGQGYFLGRPALLPLPVPPVGIWPNAPGTLPRIVSSHTSAQFRLALGPTPEPSPAVRSLPRLAALEATELMDSRVDEGFDRIARLAASLLGAPVALISLVDNHRQFFKSAIGLVGPAANLRETPLSHSFCQHTVTSQSPLVVDDARIHPLVRDNPSIAQLGITAYAGVPLITSDAHVLGALCVIDSSPRKWTQQDVATLTELGKMVVAQIELGNKLRLLEDYQVLSEWVFGQMASGLKLGEVSGPE